MVYLNFVGIVINHLPMKQKVENMISHFVFEAKISKFLLNSIKKKSKM